MTSAFATKLGLSTWLTRIGAQKIEGSALKSYDMVLARYLIQDNLDKIWNFETTILLADISIDIVLNMSFLAYSNADIQFNTENFTWKTYRVAKALLTARRIELIDRHKFDTTALNENSGTFVVYVIALKALESILHPSWDSLPGAL